MLIRALIVLLVIFNLGVAAWWITQPDPPPPAPEALPEGVPELQLVISPAPAVQPEEPASTVADDAPVDTAEVTVAGQCFSLGPLADRVAADALVATVDVRATKTRVRETSAAATGSYRIHMPPSASREEAQALARRISEAGFDDYLLVATGPDANSIALGLYRNREGAQRRLEALQAAGFAAQMQSPDASAQWWLDVMAAEGFTAAQARALPGVPGVVALGCTDLR